MVSRGSVYEKKCDVTYIGLRFSEGKEKSTDEPS